MATIMQLAAMAEDTRVNLMVIDAANNAIPGQYYRATDTDEYAFGRENGTLRWLANEDALLSVDSTDTVDLSLVDGILTANARLNGDASNDIQSGENGLFVDVSASSVTDTNDIIGGGAVEVDVQALFDAISGVAKTAVQSFDVTDGTTAVSITDGKQVGYSYGSLIAGTVVDDGNGNAAWTVGLDTDGATSGQVIKMVNIGTEEAPELVPQWAVDSASGFTQYSVPFALEDGTLGEENEIFRYNDDENKFHINLPNAERALGDWRAQSNFVMRYDGGDNGGTQPNNITTFGMSGGGGTVFFSYQDVGVPVAKMQLTSRKVDTNGDWAEYSVGDAVGSYQVSATVNESYKVGNGGRFNNHYNILTGVVTDAEGTYANGDHKVGMGFVIGAHDKDSAWNVSTPVISGDHNQQVTLHGYTNENANYLYTDANGVIQMGEYYLPATTGAENQILQMVNNGTAEAPELALEWVDAGTGFVASADNGLSVTAEGVAQLGGSLLKTTTIDTIGHSLNIENDDLAFTVADGEMQFRGAPGKFKMTNAALTFQDDRIGAAQVGIEYLGDYSATFTDNSLITKKYADDLVGNQTYQNGISEDSTTGAIELGGSLLKTTTIGLDSFGLNFTTTGGSINSTADINISDTAKGLILTAASGAQYRVGVAEDQLGNGFLTVTATGNSVQ